MDAGIFSRLHDITPADGTIKERNVFRHRTADEENILIHRRQRTGDYLAGQIPAGHAVQKHLAAPFLIEPCDNLGQRTLAAARCAHHRNPAAGTGVQIEMLQKRPFQRTVAKAHILQPQVPRQTVKGYLFLSFLLRGRKIQTVHLISAHVIQTLHLHFRGLQGGTQAHQRIDRRLKAAHQMLECHEHTRCHRTFHNGKTAHGHNERTIDSCQQGRQELYRHRP